MPSEIVPYGLITRSAPTSCAGLACTLTEPVCLSLPLLASPDSSVEQVTAYGPPTALAVQVGNVTWTQVPAAWPETETA